MCLYNLYIPSMHDELAHPRIRYSMPTLTKLSCQLWSNVVPKLEAQYLLSGIKYVHVSFSVSLWFFSVSLWSFSVSFRSLLVLFGPFRFLSVLFGVYSYR